MSTASSDLLRQAGDLKGQLVAFAQQTPRISKQLNKALARQFDDVVLEDEADLINAIDRFVLQERLPDGKTALEHFCNRRRALSDADRRLLLGWRDVVEGVFEIDGRSSDGGLETRNVIDELPYRILSNRGPGVLAAARRKRYLLARVVPLGGDDWMLSGVCSLLSRAHRRQLLRVAADLAMRYPHLALRNPDKLARAWELQHRERELFLEFFAADLVVIPGNQLQQRWDEFWHWRLRQPPLRAPGARRRTARVAQPMVEIDLPEQLCDADTVGVVYDETEGLTFLAEFGRAQAAFADPQLVVDRECRRTVLGYLKDDSVSTLPLRRLATGEPENASLLFRRMLSKPNFVWERDGEALLRKYKPGCFTQAPLPRIVPLGDTLVQALRVA